MKYFLAIDIGASSGRHILGYRDGKGEVVLREIYRFENGAERRGERLYWNTEKLFSRVCEGIAKCREIGIIPESIGIDTWGVDYALLDKNGKIIDGVISYRDDRTLGIPEEVYGIVPKRELYRRTGIAEHTFNTIFQLYEDKKSGRLASAEKMLFVPCYLNYLLTGNAVNEYTFASTTGLLDAKTRDWDRELIGLLGLPQKLFDRLGQPGSVVGMLDPSIAGFTCPVVLPACHDTASAVAAVPEGKRLWISSGTWSLIGIESDSPCTTEEAESAGFTNEGGLDGRIRFLKNIMGLWIIQSVKRELKGQYNYEQLMKFAESSFYEGYLRVDDDRLLSPASMTEAIKSSLADSGQPAPQDIGDLMKAVYRGLAASYAEAADSIERITGERFDTIAIIGGGSRDRYLNRLTGELSHRRVVTGSPEATALGNILVQMKSSKKNRGN